MGLIIGASVVFLYVFGHAQEKKFASKQSIEECIQNFNIDEAVLNLPALKGYLPYLTEYSVCRAAQEDNLEWCDDMCSNSQSVCRECKRNFNQFHAFIGRLFVAKRITPLSLSACMAKGGDFNEQVCRNVAEGLLTKDTSKCDNLPANMKDDCRKMISASVPNNSSKNGYITAMRAGIVSICNNINNEKVRALCQGELDKDQNVCKKNKGFDIFRRKYCEIMTH